MTQRTALIGMLKVGNTGDEILQILDVIVADTNEKVMNEIAEILILRVITEGGTHFLPFVYSNI